MLIPRLRLSGVYHLLRSVEVNLYTAVLLPTICSSVTLYWVLRTIAVYPLQLGVLYAVLRDIVSDRLRTADGKRVVYRICSRAIRIALYVNGDVRVLPHDIT